MSKLIDEHGKVHPALIVLARTTGIDDLSHNSTPDEVNLKLQSEWVQKGKQRLEINGAAPNSAWLETLAMLGCIDEVHAPYGVPGAYDGALLLGASLMSVRKRLAFLASEYRQRGIDFKRVYLLGSGRRLNSDKENSTSLQFPSEGLDLKRAWKSGKMDLPTNEIEMMKFVVEQSEIPEEWEIISVQAPDVQLSGGKTRPANTGETFLQWQKDTSIVDGRFLLASHNPFVAYQETNARRVLPRGIEVFGIGSKANVFLPLQTFLDNLAKQFYEEVILHKALVTH